MITNHVHYAPFTSEAIATRSPFVRGLEIRWNDTRHKYGSALAEYLDLCDDEDEATGDANEWRFYVRRFGKRLVVTDSQGFVYVTRFDNEDEAIREFEEIDTEYCEDTSEDEDEDTIALAHEWVQNNIGGRATRDERAIARATLDGINEGDPLALDALEGADEDTIALACREFLASQALDSLRDHNANTLAGLADCASPDSSISAGADFLRIVRDSLVERLADSVRLNEDEASDLAHEIADSCVPIYTHDLWSVFVDLSAYNEDTSDLVGEGADLTTHAQIALYQIADRLACALWSEYNEDTSA